MELDSDVHTAKPDTKELKYRKAPEFLPAELLKYRGLVLICKIHRRMFAVWRSEPVTEGWKESIIIPI